MAHIDPAALNVQNLALAAAVANENVAPNVGLEPAEGCAGERKAEAKKDWERETAAERLARRTKYLELANDKDPKTVSL